MNRFYLLVIALFILVGCVAVGRKTLAEGSKSKETADTPELGTTMIYMQRYSQKLGLAVEKRNKDLALFYLDELRETIDDIVKHFPEENGDPIADIANSVIVAPVKALGKPVSEGDWRQVDKGYREIINGCNNCHSLTGHAYIKIIVGRSKQIYNQEF